MLNDEKCPIDNRWHKVGVTVGEGSWLMKEDTIDRDVYDENILMTNRELCVNVCINTNTYSILVECINTIFENKTQSDVGRIIPLMGRYESEIISVVLIPEYGEYSQFIIYKCLLNEGTSLVLYKTDIEDNIHMSIRGLVDISRTKEDQLGCSLLKRGLL